MTETVTILKLEKYDGQRTEYTNMYFRTQDGAVEWLEKNGYEPDSIFEWKKDRFQTAKIENEELH